MSGYLFDTNVLSETYRRAPNANVVTFVASLDPSDVYTSAIVIAELRRGAERKALTDLNEGVRISDWIDGIEVNMEGRIIPVEERVAAQWGKLQSHQDRPFMDMLIAATAVVHGLTLVTRNVRDFQGIDLEILNPW